MQEEDAVDALFPPAEEAPEAVGAPVEAPEPAPVVEPTPAEAAPEPEKQEHTVPLPKYLDTRDENRELKRRLAEFEAQQKPKATPDPYDDPKGFEAHLEQVVEAKTTNSRFQISDVVAKREFGEETVASATEWALEKAKADPVFAAQYMREAHPIDWIVRQHKRDSLVSQLPSDVSSLDELVEREIAKRGLSVPPAAPVLTVAAPVEQAVKPPKSIASESGGSGTVADDKAEFIAIFDRK